LNSDEFNPAPLRGFRDLGSVYKCRYLLTYLLSNHPADRTLWGWGPLPKLTERQDLAENLVGGE